MNLRTFGIPYKKIIIKHMAIFFDRRPLKYQFYEGFKYLLRDFKPSLNTQMESIKAKLFNTHIFKECLYSAISHGNLYCYYNGLIVCCTLTFSRMFYLICIFHLYIYPVLNTNDLLVIYF